MSRRNRPTRHQIQSGFTTRKPRGYMAPEQEGPPEPGPVALSFEAEVDAHFAMMRFRKAAHRYLTRPRPSST